MLPTPLRVVHWEGAQQVQMHLGEKTRAPNLGSHQCVPCRSAHCAALPGPISQTSGVLLPRVNGGSSGSQDRTLGVPVGTTAWQVQATRAPIEVGTVTAPAVSALVGYARHASLLEPCVRGIPLPRSCYETQYRMTINSAHLQSLILLSYPLAKL